MARKGTNYKRGVIKEREIMDEKSSKGMESIRTAGSHGVFDVISWSDKEVVFTQAKREKTSPKSVVAKYNKYREDIHQISLTKTPKGNTLKELLVWTDRQGFTSILIL